MLWDFKAGSEGKIYGEEYWIQYQTPYDNCRKETGESIRSFACWKDKLLKKDQSYQWMNIRAYETASHISFLCEAVSYTPKIHSPKWTFPGHRKSVNRKLVSTVQFCFATPRKRYLRCPLLQTHFYLNLYLVFAVVVLHQQLNEDWQKNGKRKIIYRNKERNIRKQKLSRYYLSVEGHGDRALKVHPGDG